MKDFFNGIKFNFINFLAFTVLIICLGYLFYVSSSKFPADRLKDIGDIKIAFIQIISLILGYFFVASKKDNGNNQNNNTNTMSDQVYFETTTENQNITHVNGSAIQATSLANWLSTHPAWSVYDGGSATYYPSVVAPDNITSITVSTDGVLTANLVTGTHPPRRPK